MFPTPQILGLSVHWDKGWHAKKQMKAVDNKNYKNPLVQLETNKICESTPRRGDLLVQTHPVYCVRYIFLSFPHFIVLR